MSRIWAKLTDTKAAVSKNAFVMMALRVFIIMQISFFYELCDIYISIYFKINGTAMKISETSVVLHGVTQSESSAKTGDVAKTITAIAHSGIVFEIFIKSSFPGLYFLN
jgi:hypothetical protein